MTQEMLFSKYAEQYPLTVPQEAVENELQLLILEIETPSFCIPYSLTLCCRCYHILEALSIVNSKNI